MSIYNIQNIQGSASFTMADGSILNVANLAIEIDGKIIIPTASVSIKIEEGVLKIKTKANE